ncbi:MAG: DUF6034 family protein [Clostridia bacterium]|nr:DUF6034 family protein [Clostridia bacterium]
MKRIIILCLICTLLLACVPTPEEDAVKQKNTNVLIDTVIKEEQRDEQKPEQQGEAIPTPEPAKALMPERFQCDFVTNDGARIEGDVLIRILTDSVFPMLRVERRSLTDAERLTLAARFLGTDDLYIYQDVLSRKSVEDMIRGLLEEPTFEEYRKDYAFSGATKEDYDAFISYRREQLAYWQEYYRNIPADDAPMPFQKWDGAAPTGETTFTIIVTESEGRTNIAFQPNVFVFRDDRGRAIEYTEPQSDRSKNVTASGFNITSKPGVERIEPEDYDVVHDGASVTPRAAADAALAYFDGLVTLGIDDVYWSNNADTDGDGAGVVGTYGYLIRLTPVYDGSEAPYINLYGVHSDREEAELQYAPEWYYESVIAAVSADGKPLSLAWYGASKITETITESTPLLSFEEIMRLFEQQMNRQLYGKGATVQITGVKLGLFRIREQNSMETGLMIPAWILCGTYDSADGDHRELSPICVINAIDGSIIDWRKGY